MTSQFHHSFHDTKVLVISHPQYVTRAIAKIAIKVVSRFDDKVMSDEY